MIELKIEFNTLLKQIGKKVFMHNIVYHGLRYAL
jgi:hypothetical protein